MIIGTMNNPHKGLVEQIHLAGEMGFDYFELTIEHPHARPQWLTSHKKEVMDALGAYNLGLLAHMPWYFGIAHPYERIQKATNAEFEEAFRAAALLGAKKATLHTEMLSPSLRNRENMLSESIKTLSALSKTASNMGLELLVENINSRSMSISEFKRLFSEVEMGMTFDVGHCHTAGGEGLQPYLDAFHQRIKHMHMHDNMGSSDDHLPLGVGRIDFKKAVESIKKVYDGTITLEVHCDDPHYAEYSRQRLEILWYGKKKFRENQDYLYPDQAQAANAKTKKRAR